MQREQATPGPSATTEKEAGLRGFLRALDRPLELMEREATMGEKIEFLRGFGPKW